MRGHPKLRLLQGMQELKTRSVQTRIKALALRSPGNYTRKVLNNPQVLGINVARLNVEVLGIKPREQEGKAIYSLKLECHNYSYLCTAQDKETSEIDLVITSNKVIKQGK
jgi:hypothetical protein